MKTKEKKRTLYVKRRSRFTPLHGDNNIMLHKNRFLRKNPMSDIRNHYDIYDLSLDGYRLVYHERTLLCSRHHRVKNVTLYN